jgi:uncharacterized protein (TIGR02466 family)
VIVSDKTFEALEILPIFPTFVWKAELPTDQSASLNPALINALMGLGAPLSGLRPGENWQSSHDLHKIAEAQPLVDWISSAARNLLDYLRIPEPVMITGCWANVNAPGTGHRLHSHRNNYLSGAYYIQTQPGADTINFFDPKIQAGVMRPWASKPTAENTEVAMIRVTSGTLLLFPAWLQHAVDTNRSNTARISISFNLMFPSFAEQMAQPGWKPGIGG